MTADQPLLPNGEVFIPNQWEEIEQHAEAAKGRQYHGGTSVQIVYRNKNTGVVITRHRIEMEGTIVHDHFRPGGAKR